MKRVPSSIVDRSMYDDQLSKVKVLQKMTKKQKRTGPPELTLLDDDLEHSNEHVFEHFTECVFEYI